LQEQELVEADFHGLLDSQQLPFDRLRPNGHCLNVLIFRSC
jgi:hypothetical protein